MEELDLEYIKVGTNADTDGDIDIFAKGHKGVDLYIDRIDSIKLIDHLTKVFDIKQEQA